jgi:murein DD-endopeptidase MepM/ murein hydrolase activator NlpD
VADQPPNTDPWDRDPNRPSEQAFDELGQRAARSAASQRAKVSSDVNAAVPAPEYDKVTGNRLYETVPVPLKRLFSSPLDKKGSYAKGPSGERLVSSGWGDPRSSGYNEHVNSAARHQALDFVANFGEPVYAMSSGTVRFVGFQSKQGAVEVPGIHADDAKEIIYDGKGNEVASTAANNIGFGGIAVWVRHDKDFQGYQTEYYHLSNTHVEYGQYVQEGDLIGNIGGTGGYYNWFHKGTHLHMQVAFTSGGLRVLVRPTAMVPNYWPNHLDSTNSNEATNIIMPILASVGLQSASGTVANVLGSLNRANTMQNKGIADVKNDQSQYADHVAQTLDVHRSALYAVAAAFKGQPPVVVAPMTFDFDAGTWSDGKVT